MGGSTNVGRHGTIAARWLTLMAVVGLLATCTEPGVECGGNHAPSSSDVYSDLGRRQHGGECISRRVARTERQRTCSRRWACSTCQSGKWVPIPCLTAGAVRGCLREREQDLARLCARPVDAGRAAGSDRRGPRDLQGSHRERPGANGATGATGSTGATGATGPTETTGSDRLAQGDAGAVSLVVQSPQVTQCHLARTAGMQIESGVDPGTTTISSKPGRSRRSRTSAMGCRGRRSRLSLPSRPDRTRHAGGERIDVGLHSDGGFVVQQSVYVCNGTSSGMDGGAGSAGGTIGTGGAGMGGDRSDGAVGRRIQSLTISPENPFVELDLGVSGAQNFVVTAHYSDGSTDDQTANAAWTVANPLVGLMNGATLVIPTVECRRRP